MSNMACFLQNYQNVCFASKFLQGEKKKKKPPYCAWVKSIKQFGLGNYAKTEVFLFVKIFISPHPSPRKNALQNKTTAL